MTEAIQTLMNEHRLIEKVLDSLATFVTKLEAGPPEARKTVAQYALFFREFADRCHHGKEEDRLFVRMADHGFSPEWGPLKVMLQEHHLGRARVRELASIGDGEGPLSDGELQQARRSASEFSELLRAHIQKEDSILYPAAEESVPASVLEALAKEFEEFEREVMGEGSHARLHQTAEQLIQAYPPGK
jgi:hemerythrin-like domain-containing protein